MHHPPGPYRYLLYLLAYFGCFVLTYYGLYSLGYLDRLPTEEGLVKWDAGFYRSIADKGYEYAGGQPASAGFYPLFAYIWRLTGLSGVGISLLNAGVFLAALWGLCVTLRPHPLTLGLYFSLPFVFFFYTPLSEAWFFAFATLAIVGLLRQQRWVVFAGLLLSGLTRPTFLFLIPALVGMELMLRPPREALGWAVWRKILSWYLLPVGLAAATVAVIQYLQVGDAFAYYRTQSEGWGRQFGLPVFPLAGGGENFLSRLRTANVWIGVLAAAFGLTWLVRWLVRGRIGTDLRPVELVAVIYLCMCLVSILFFNPEWKWMMEGEYGATVLTGINRYLQPNPFLFIFMIFLFDRPRGPLLYLVPLLLLTHLLWFAFDFDYYEHIRKYLVISYVTFMILPYWAYYYLRWKPLGYAIIPAGLYFQCLMFVMFMGGVHVD
ncbi:hypothetical protein [Lewinella sp. IMCC34183]|uniref:hypothetical protein n=1 Tax=Lewinella sp. IMCC34183 TaxID=2248762 RepID=UPI000E28788D|nr:hypothetical protein [Lewinella sp. IMCC34183]